MTALLTLTMVLLAPVPEPAPLKWKLAKGDVFYSKTAVSLKQTVTVMEKEVEQEQDQTTYNRFKVLTADAKGYTIEQTMQKSEVKGNMPGAEDAAAKMKGIVLTYKMNEKFEVTKVEGIGDLIDKLAGEDKAVRKALASTLSEELFAAGFAELFRTAPDKPVKLGDKWNRNYKLPMGGGLGNLKIDADFKYSKSGEAGDRVTWSAKTKYEVSKPDPDAPFHFTAGELNAEEYTGEYLFDSKLGRLKSHTSKAKINGTMTLSVNGMEIEMAMKQNIVTTSTISEKSLVKD